jgi:hypothetical protein
VARSTAREEAARAALAEHSPDAAVAELRQAARERLAAAELAVTDAAAAEQATAASLAEVDAAYAAAAAAEEQALNEAEHLDRTKLVDDLDWAIMSRLAGVRSVGLAGSLPLVLDDPFAVLDDDELTTVLDRWPASPTPCRSWWCPTAKRWWPGRHRWALNGCSSPRPDSSHARVGGRPEGGSSGVLGALRPLLALGDLLERLGSALEATGVGELAGLELLVHVEEVLDLVGEVVGERVDVLDVVPARIAGGHADDLGVGAGIVLHPEDADGSASHPAAGERGLLQDHQRVERIAVLAERVVDVAVVGGVDRGREEAAVEPDLTRS